MQTTPQTTPATNKKHVSLTVSTRYIRRFGGFHEKYWMDYDKQHVLGRIRLLTKHEDCIAEVDIPNIKPLPKCTLAGFLISLALEGKTEFVGF